MDADKLAQTISEPLMWAEMCFRYPDKWACLVEIDRSDPTTSTSTPGVSPATARAP